MAFIARYETGEEVRLGDRVRLRRWIRSPLEGVVDFVHDPTKPAPPKGDNDVGFSVRLNDQRGWIWFGAKIHKRLELMSRALSPVEEHG